MKKILFALLVLSVVFVVGCGANEPVPTVDDLDDTMDGDSEDVDSEGNDRSDDGGKSVYVRYDKGHYEQSVSEGKVVLLDFYASWCPICRSENPKIREGVSEFDSGNIIAYQVHFNDGETNSDDEEIANTFGITLQHTKVVVKNGEQFSKSLESWDKDKTVSEINKALS